VIIVNAIGPVFAIIGIGALLHRFRFVDGEFIKGINRLVYWVGLPCLLVAKIGVSPPALGARAGQAALVVGIGVLASLAMGALACKALRLPASYRGTFLQAAFRGNLAFVGLPIVIYSVGETGTAIAVLVLAFVVPIYNAVAVCVLLLGHGGFTRARLRTTGYKLITNPLLLSCLAGMGIAYSGLVMPLPVSRTLNAIGDMSLPLALLSIGASMHQFGIHGRIASALSAGLIKCILTPLVGVGVAKLLGVDALATCVALVFLAAPTAAASYVMALEMDGDDKLAASTVVVSTFMAIISLSIVIALFAPQL
jgi:malate permease and related proteins